MADEHIQRVANFGEVITVLDKPTADILVQCRDRKLGNVYVPLSKLFAAFKGQIAGEIVGEIAKEIRAQGGRAHGIH